MIKLQLNNSGAWKSVLEFHDDHAEKVKSLVEDLSIFDVRGWGKTKWRLVDDADVVKASWTSPTGWQAR